MEAALFQRFRILPIHRSSSKANFLCSTLQRAERTKVFAMLEKQRNVSAQLADDQARQLHAAMVDMIQRKYDQVDALVKELEAEAAAP